MLGWITLIVALASTAVSAYSTYQSSQASKAEAKYNEEVAEANAAEAAKNASNIRQQGEWEKRKLALETLEKEGKARTGYAASGVALGSGTASSYMADIRDAYTLDLKQLDYDISQRVREAELQGVDYTNQANLFDLQASNTSKIGSIATASSALSGLASTGTTYFNLKSSGTFK